MKNWGGGGEGYQNLNKILKKSNGKFTDFQKKNPDRHLDKKTFNFQAKKNQFAE